MKKHVQAGTDLYSDELGGYKGLQGEYQHKVINHAVKYVDGRVHTNGIENFWSLLKRGISGTSIGSGIWTSKLTAITIAPLKTIP